jgi:hypothetical protein
MEVLGNGAFRMFTTYAFHADLQRAKLGVKHVLKEWFEGVDMGGQRRTAPLLVLESREDHKWRNGSQMKDAIAWRKCIVYGAYRRYYGHPVTSQAGSPQHPAALSWQQVIQTLELMAR